MGLHGSSFLLFVCLFTFLLREDLQKAGFRCILVQIHFIPHGFTCFVSSEGELSAEGDFLASGDVLFKIHFAVLEYIIVFYSMCSCLLSLLVCFCFSWP